MTTYRVEFDLNIDESYLLRTLLWYTLGLLDAEIQNDPKAPRKGMQRYIILEILRKLGRHGFTADESQAIVMEELIIPKCKEVEESKKNVRPGPFTSGIEFIWSEFSNEVIMSLKQKLTDKSNYKLSSTNNFWKTGIK